MSKPLSKKKVMRLLKTNDLSTLTKEELTIFAPLLARMSPETAKEIMDQFVDFRMAANTLAGILRAKSFKSFNLKDEQQLQLYTVCCETLKNLDTQLISQSISDNDKQAIKDNLILAAQMLAANTKYKRKNT